MYRHTKHLDKCLGAAVVVVGWVGLLFGSLGSFRSTVLGLIGREVASRAAVDTGAVVLLTLTYAALLIVFYRLTSASRPLPYLFTAAILGALVVGIWLPQRQTGFTLLEPDGTVVSWDSEGFETWVGEEAQDVWESRPHRDEGREATAVRTLRSEGWSGFWRFGLEETLRLHPPLGYLIYMPFGATASLQRALACACYLLALLLVLRWSVRLDGDALAAWTGLSLVSAPSLIFSLALLANLDVLLFPLGVLVCVLVCRENVSQRLLLAASALLCVMMLIKYTTLVLIGALVLVYGKRWRQALVLAVPALFVFAAFQAVLVSQGLAYTETYFGDRFAALFLGAERVYGSGGHLKSYITIAVFGLAPLGVLTWATGLGSALVAHLRSRPVAPPRVLFVALLAFAAVLVVYPLLRYSTPALGVVALCIGMGLKGLADSCKSALVVRILISAAGAYSIAKNLGESWLGI